MISRHELDRDPGLGEAGEAFTHVHPELVPERHERDRREHHGRRGDRSRSRSLDRRTTGQEHDPQRRGRGVRDGRVDGGPLIRRESRP
jgi:hypothetical protein